MSMDVNGLDQEDPLRYLGDLLQTLEDLTRETKNDVVWNNIRKTFIFIKKFIDEFQVKMEKSFHLYTDIIGDFRLERYLLKLVAIQMISECSLHSLDLHVAGRFLEALSISERFRIADRNRLRRLAAYQKRAWNGTL